MDVDDDRNGNYGERSLKTLRLMRLEDPPECIFEVLDTSSASSCNNATSIDGLPWPNIKGRTYRADPPGPDVLEQTRDDDDRPSIGLIDGQTDFLLTQSNVIEPNNSKDELVFLIQKSDLMTQRGVWSETKIDL